jgi:GNAT superfamily N-acetyltransferase
MEPKLERLSQKIIDRYEVTIEAWDDRSLDVRKKEMLEIYNAAWNDNFGFVPFTQEEFDQIIDDMLMIMDKELFIFLYVKGEAAAFFGGVPNVAELLPRVGTLRHVELLRAIKMLMGARKTKGFRLGYLGVKPEYRRLGLDGVMLWKQKLYSRTKYSYCDMGWVLEDNLMTIRLIEMMGAEDSKTYTIYEKQL